MPMGGLELLILLVIILLFFGAKRVPEVARSLGKGKHEFHKGIKEGEAEAEEHDKAEVRQDKEESPPPDRTHPEEESVSEEGKPKAYPYSKA